MNYREDIVYYIPNSCGIKCALFITKKKFQKFNNKLPLNN